MSFWMIARKPMNSAVIAPMIRMKLSAASDSSNSGDMRSTMKMPAVTMVAAWISAEIGVGPSIESGNQACSGNWADLPMAPMNKQMPVTVKSSQPVPGSMVACSSGSLAKISL